MDNESREKLRPVLYLAAGAYLVYLAFKMYGGLGQMAGTEHTVSMIAMVVFRRVRSCNLYLRASGGEESISGSETGCIRGDPGRDRRVGAGRGKIRKLKKVIIRNLIHIVYRELKCDYKIWNEDFCYAGK